MSRNSISESWRKIILYTLLSVFVITLLTNTSCSRKPEISQWRYDQFLDYVENGQVERVTINADRSQALVITSDGQRVAVNLPSDPELLGFLQENSVDIAVSPSDIAVFSQSGDILLNLVLLIPAGIALGGFLFWVWVLIDCATKEASQGNTKLVWILIILFVNLLGAFVYFFVRRPQRLRELGQ